MADENDYSELFAALEEQTGGTADDQAAHDFITHLTSCEEADCFANDPMTRAEIVFGIFQRISDDVAKTCVILGRHGEANAAELILADMLRFTRTLYEYVAGRVASGAIIIPDTDPEAGE